MVDVLSFKIEFNHEFESSVRNKKADRYFVNYLLLFDSSKTYLLGVLPRSPPEGFPVELG